MEKVGERTFQPVQQFAPETSYEDFYPTYDWTEDSNGHILLIEIPGFTKEDVAVQLDNYGNVTVGGQRRVSERRYRRFKQVFGVPEDVNYETISARFDSGILYIILPKILPANKEEERDGGKGRSKAGLEQKDKSQTSEERREGIREGVDGQEKEKEETTDKIVGEEERKEENRKSTKKEREQRGEKRDKVGDEDQGKGKERDTIEGAVDTRQENKEQIGETRQAKRKKRVKFGEGRSGMIDGEAAKRDKIGGEGVEAKEEKREKTGEQMEVKDRRAVGGGGEREVMQRRRTEGRESSDRESSSVARGNRNRENGEASTETRDDGAVDKGMGLRSMWESAGWTRALQSDTVGKIIESMKRNKVAIASALIALSAGLYLSHKLKTGGD